MNNDNFIILISGGNRCCWVSLCTVWLLHSKWLSKESNKSASDFALSLNIPLQKLFRWCRRLQLWATDDWQLQHNKVPTHASRLLQRFWWNIKSPRWFSPFTVQIWHPATSDFSKSKVTFEREETSDHCWDSGKYDREADGNWENCVSSQGAYFEGDWAVTVLCTMFLVSSSINVSIFHITWIDTFWTYLMCVCVFVYLLHHYIYYYTACLTCTIFILYICITPFQISLLHLLKLPTK